MLESVIITTFILGLISAVSLPLGTLTAFFWRPTDRIIAILMAFGGGALLAALTLDLVGPAVARGDLVSLAIGVIAGGVMFVVLNSIINDYGGFLRKVSTTVYYLRRIHLMRRAIVVSGCLLAPLQDLSATVDLSAGFGDLADRAAHTTVAVGEETDEPSVHSRDSTENTSAHQYRLKWPEFDFGVNNDERLNMVQVFDNRSDYLDRNRAVDRTPVSTVPTFDCADVIGKVFDDSNLNGYQDEAEAGIPSVKLVTTQGLEARTDQNGRFHITCALSPNPDRGSNFIIKLDARSLPVGYRLTTENPRVVRATPGKVLKFNFGAAIHRRVRLDLADAVFESDSSQIRERWLSHVDLLMDRLEEGPAVLCLAYMADFEELTLITERLQAIKKEIKQRWAGLDCCYELDIETRIIWRDRTSTD